MVLLVSVIPPLPLPHLPLPIPRNPSSLTIAVSDTKNTSTLVPPDKQIVLIGVFGYASVEAHRAWRATAEHTNVITASDDSALGRLGLGNGLDMPGGNVFCQGE